MDFVLASLKAAFPDLKLETEVLAAEGPWVIARFTVRGTQQIALFGLPAGQVREISGVGCFSMDDGAIAGLRVYVDGGQLATQLGVTPASVGAAAAESSVPSGSWVDQFRGGAREIWLAGMGALGAASEHGERLFHELVERGRHLEGSGHTRTSDTVDTADTVDAKTRALGERARTAVSTGQEYIRDVASDLRSRLDLPTRAELDAVNRRIDQLTTRVDALAAPALIADHAAQSSAGSTSA
jgi:poly(hydroxyalkanoate) granule-associated protein